MHEPLTGIFIKSSKSKTGYQQETMISAIPVELGHCLEKPTLLTSLQQAEQQEEQQRAISSETCFCGVPGTYTTPLFPHERPAGMRCWE
jgi:hypothetical protein